MALALLNALLVAFTAAVGLFADGGEIWERLVLSVVHPIGAAALVLLVAAWTRLGGLPRTLLVAALAVNIAVDGLLTLSILLGITRGDWWLPLVSTVVPAIGLVYFAFRRRDVPTTSASPADAHEKPLNQEERPPVTRYCVKCRESREIQDAEQVTMKNGRPATRGRCGECGTTMFRIGKPS